MIWLRSIHIRNRSRFEGQICHSAQFALGHNATNKRAKSWCLLAHAAVKAQDVTVGIAHQVEFAPAKPPSKRLHLSQQGSLLFGAVVAGSEGEPSAHRRSLSGRCVKHDWARGGTRAGAPQPQGSARRGRQRGSVNEFNDIEHTPLTALLRDPQPIAKRTAAQSTAVAAGVR